MARRVGRVLPRSSTSSSKVHREASAALVAFQSAPSSANVSHRWVLQPGMFRDVGLAFARLLVRFRFAVVALWVGAALACALLLPNVEQASTGTLGDLVPSNAEAIETETRSVDLFRFPVLSRTVVVERDRDGLAPGRVADIYLRSVAIGLGRIPALESIPFALPVTDSLLANDPQARPHAALTYLFFPPDIGPVGRTGLAQLLVDSRLQAPRVQDRGHGRRAGPRGADHRDHRRPAAGRVGDAAAGHGCRRIPLPLAGRAAAQRAHRGARVRSCRSCRRRCWQRDRHRRPAGGRAGDGRARCSASSPTT